MTMSAVAESVPTSKVFTVGKSYPTRDGGDENCFLTDDDRGEERYCRWIGCAHLDGGNWTRTEEPTPSHTVSQDRAVEAVVKAANKLIASCAKVDESDPEYVVHGPYLDRLRSALTAFKKSEVGHE